MQKRNINGDSGTNLVTLRYNPYIQMDVLWGVGGSVFSTIMDIHYSPYFHLQKIIKHAAVSSIAANDHVWYLIGIFFRSRNVENYRKANRKTENSCHEKFWLATTREIFMLNIYVTATEHSHFRLLLEWLCQLDRTDISSSFGKVDIRLCLSRLLKDVLKQDSREIFVQLHYANNKLRQKIWNEFVVR